MKSTVSRVILSVVSSSFIFMCCAHQDAVVVAQQHPPLKATRLYTGSDGLTHFDSVDVWFSPVAGAPASIEQSEPVKVTRSYVVRAAPGTFESWHNSSERRYEITVRGQAEIEIAGGQKIFAEPGRICLAEDLTGKGHTFRVLGSDDWVALFVDLAR
jgi:hypothetical protein